VTMKGEHGEDYKVRMLRAKTEHHAEHLRALGELMDHHLTLVREKIADDVESTAKFVNPLHPESRGATEELAEQLHQTIKEKEQVEQEFSKSLSKLDQSILDQKQALGKLGYDVDGRDASAVA
jgi:predicted translin family RNA/ssDNA-binding protein